MWRVVALLLLAGCFGTDVEYGWLVEDPADDGHPGADILHLQIDEGGETRVEVLLAAPLAVADGTVQVLLETDAGYYQLNATPDEATAAYGVDPCEGCPTAPHTHVGAGTLDGRVAQWIFTRDHALTGRVLAQTIGAGPDGPCLHDWVGQGVPEPPAPWC